MRKFLVDLGDRVGSTAVQAFAGSLGAASLVGFGFGDWKTAVVAATGAALLAGVKALGIAAAQLKAQADASAPAAEAQVVQVVEADAEKVAQAIGQKLSK